MTRLFPSMRTLVRARPPSLLASQQQQQQQQQTRPMSDSLSDIVSRQDGRYAFPDHHKRPRVKAAMIDLNGTLHVGDRPLPGAIEAVEELRKNGFLLKFVTNSSRESRRSLLARLRRIGFDVVDEELHSALTAAKMKIKRENLKPLLLLSDSALEDFYGVGRGGGVIGGGVIGGDIGEHSNYDSVVVGFAPEKFHHDATTTAMNVLMNGGRLMAVNKARYHKSKDGCLEAGAGSFVAGLEFCAGVEADLIGKPTPAFFENALQSLRHKWWSSPPSSSPPSSSPPSSSPSSSSPPSSSTPLSSPPSSSPSSSPTSSSHFTRLRNDEVVMIGDDFKDDILGARVVGCKGILVRTGKYRTGDGERSILSPEAVCEDFAEAVRFVLDCRI